MSKMHSTGMANSKSPGVSTGLATGLTTRSKPGNIRGIRRVNLNHAHTSGGPSPVSHAMLVLGLLSLCLALYALHSLKLQKQALIAERDSLQHPQLAMANLNSVESSSSQLSTPQLNKQHIKNGEKRSESNAELAEVSAARQALALPWEPLFAMLERIQGPDVRILAIDPNAKKHMLKLTVEAASAEAMLAYVKTLGSQAILQDVVLQSHQYTADGRALPFSFMIEAVWLN